jgi:anti-anti-sigma regulatory factor
MNNRAAQVLLETCEEYLKRGVQIFLTHVNARPYQTFVKAGLVDLVGMDAFRETVADAVGILQRAEAVA